MEDVDVAICIRNDHVELFAIRQEVRRYDFNMVWRFAEEAELVWLFLHAKCQYALLLIPHSPEKGLTI